MTKPNLSPVSKLLLRGIHLSLTAAMREALEHKAERLLRHEPRIDRIRVDLEHDRTRGQDVFVAKGHIEISGPDLLASVSAEDAYKAADLLMDKLDALLRKRADAPRARRNNPSRDPEV
jgi:putative sigma-54 modulation protein